MASGVSGAVVDAKPGFGTVVRLAEYLCRFVALARRRSFADDGAAVLAELEPV